MACWRGLKILNLLTKSNLLLSLTFNSWQRDKRYSICLSIWIVNRFVCLKNHKSLRILLTFSKWEISFRYTKTNTIPWEENQTRRFPKWRPKESKIKMRKTKTKWRKMPNKKHCSTKLSIRKKKIFQPQIQSQTMSRKNSYLLKESKAERKAWKHWVSVLRS